MRNLSILAVILTLGLSLGITDAEAARRLGGGKSFGVQRQMTTPTKAPTAAPAPSQSATAASAAAGAPAAAAAPKRSWMGPLAGLAAGLGLAALASHFGFGGELASMMMIGLLVMAVIMVIGFFMRKRAGGQSPAMAGAGTGGFQYREPAADYTAPASKSNVVSMPGSSVNTEAPTAKNIPSDFDTAGFARNAKVNFIRLQAANDAANLDDIREFTTPEMFAELKMNITDRGVAAQETDVVTIDAEVLEVVEEATRYVVSVRFTGLLREEKDAATEAIDEIWHLVKAREGKGGWLLAGIQQTQ